MQVRLPTASLSPQHGLPRALPSESLLQGRSPEIDLLCIPAPLITHSSCDTVTAYVWQISFHEKDKTTGVIHASVSLQLSGCMCGCLKTVVEQWARLHVSHQPVRAHHDRRQQMKPGVVVWLEGGWCFDKYIKCWCSENDSAPLNTKHNDAALPGIVVLGLRDENHLSALLCNLD